MNVRQRRKWAILNHHHHANGTNRQDATERDGKQGRKAGRPEGIVCPFQLFRSSRLSSLTTINGGKSHSPLERSHVKLIRRKFG